MLIRIFLKQSHGFDDEAIRVMGIAYEFATALNGAIKEMRPCRRQRSSVLPARTSETVFARLGAMSR
jgi:hypothetical protein